MPTLKRDDGAIIDNLRAHCVAGMRKLIEAAGDVVAIELFGVSREIALQREARKPLRHRSVQQRFSADRITQRPAMITQGKYVYASTAATSVGLPQPAIRYWYGSC